MYGEVEVPPVAEPAAAISQYWTRRAFAGSISTNRDINALLSTCMRLVEAAVFEYNMGSAALHRLWSNQQSIGLREMNRSISHFETCITSVHRAFNAHRRLRRHRSQDPLCVFLGAERPSFVSDAVAGRIRDLRNAVHHVDDKLLDGEIAIGDPIALRPDGTEVAHPSEPGQTIKTFDRLVIGNLTLTFQDLANLLQEMAGVADRISTYDRGCN